MNVRELLKKIFRRAKKEEKKEACQPKTYYSRRPCPKCGSKVAVSGPDDPGWWEVCTNPKYSHKWAA